MTINITNLTKLINHLRLVNNKNFSMKDWHHYTNSESRDKWRMKPASELVSYMEQGQGDCGTVACIAGHAAILITAEKETPMCNIAYGSHLQHEATVWLGLESDEARALFKPGSYTNDGYYTGNIITDYSLDEALQVLENLKETAEMGEPKITWPGNDSA